MSQEPITEIEESVIEDIRSRRDIGRAKYGKTMERDDLSLLDWHIHHYQELLDAAIYTKKIIQILKQP